MIARLDFAPLDGITKRVFRRVWHARFGGADRYFIPFISPTDQHIITPRDRRELENPEGLPQVPQVMAKRAADFVWAAEALADMGYEEVNLNLGCPSGTVTAKGKGSGLLMDPDFLDRFLDGVFSGTSVPVSVKTRLGYNTPEEFPRLLEVFNRYPIACLTIHPRVRPEKYRGAVHMDLFALAVAESKNPVCYNGDLTSVAGVRALEAQFPGLDAAMIGRGAIADPALLRRLRRHERGAASLHPGALPGLSGLLRPGRPRQPGRPRLPADEGGLVLPDPSLRGRGAIRRQDAPLPGTGGI